MSKKAESTTQAAKGQIPESGEIVKRPESGHLADMLTATHLREKLGIEIDLDLPAGVLVRNAVEAINAAEKLNIAAGVALLKARAMCEHGQFEVYLKECGIPKQRASEHMAITKALLAADDVERRKLLQQPKTALIGIARMDEEVRQHLLDTGELDAQLTIGEYKQLLTNQGLDLKRKDEEIHALRAKLAQEGGRSSTGDVPAAVADIRAEVAALVKKSELSIADIYQQLAGMAPLLGVEGVAEWVKPTAQLCMAGLVALRVQLDGAINQVAEHYGLTKLADTPPDVLAELGGDEVAQVAQQWASLVQQHRHEAALREFEREQAKPRGRGAPRKAPKAPE